MSITPFSVAPTAIDGLMIMQTKEIRDDRGVVREYYRESSFLDAGLPSLGKWLQMNVTESNHGVIRGLHGEEMYKLIGIVAGVAFGAWVDVRPGSSTLGNVVTQRLTIGTQVLVPKGVCNGFQSVSEAPTQYLYAFDQEWIAGMAGAAVNPLDPALGIDWPVPVDTSNFAQVSQKDSGAPSLRNVIDS